MIKFVVLNVYHIIVFDNTALKIEVIVLLLCMFFIVLDENYSVKHTSRGILGMANQGRHTNGSQYYITFQPAPWMDTKYVAFG